MTVEKESTSKQIRKRHLCCCCVCGFIFGCSAIIGLIAGLTYYSFKQFNELLSRNESMSACPTSWILHGRHCYYFSSYNKSWEHAEQNCVKMNAYLADVLNKEDSTWLTASVVDINEDVWIGGKGKNGTNFEWNYGKSLNAKIDHFTNWAAGQPSYANGPAQNCIQLWKEQQFKWDNEYCSKKRKFVCKQQI